MDRKTILAMTLCFLIYMGWQKLYLEPQLHSEGAAKQATISNEIPKATEPSTATKTTPLENSRPQVAANPAQKLSIHTGVGDAILGDSGPFFVGWNLKSYKLGISPEAAAVDLHSVTNQGGAVNLAFDDPSFAYLNDVQGK